MNGPDLLTATAVGAGWATHGVLLRRRLRTARQDPLTGVWTRAAFAMKAGRLLDRRECLVALADVDRFKEINDTYGHGAGDAALVEVAGCLSRWAGARGVAGRFGGDEFVAVRPVAAEERPTDLVNGLGRDLRRTMRYGTLVLDVVVSVGAAHLTMPGLRLADALQVADGAMYQAKRDGTSVTRVVRASGAAGHGWRPRRHKRTGLPGPATASPRV
jgi:diguanylate cyclase (GGDEF)-like protein